MPRKKSKHRAVSISGKSKGRRRTRVGKLKPRGRPNPQNLRPWKKGQSGNPKGLPHWYRELRALFRENSEPAARRIVELARDASEKRLSLAACEAIIDRAGLQPFKVEPDRHEVNLNSDLDGAVVAELAAFRARRGAAGVPVEPARANEAPGPGGAEGSGATVAAAPRAADSGIRKPG